MPRVNSGGGKFRLPGVYETLQTGLCGHVTGDWCGLDPRSDPRFRSGTGPSSREMAVWKWLRAECSWKAEQDRAERLAAGEPLEVARSIFGGHSIPRQDSWPAWLRDHFGGVKTVRVHPDDTVEPTDR